MSRAEQERRLLCMTLAQLGRQKYNVVWPDALHQGYHYLGAAMAHPDQLTLAVSDLLHQIPDHFRAEVLGNIVLAGGGSRLHGLGNALEHACSSFGICKVSAIYDSRFAGADGALKLAMRINDDTWSALTETTLSQASPSQTRPGAAA